MIVNELIEIGNFKNENCTCGDGKCTCIIKYPNHQLSPLIQTTHSLTVCANSSLCNFISVPSRLIIIYKYKGDSISQIKLVCK